MKKFASLLCAAALVFTLSGCTSQPKDDGDSTATNGTLTLGTSADFAPYEFHKLVDGVDTIMGFDISLAKQIAADMGKELVIKDIAFESLIGELNNGTIDLILAGMSPDPERSKEVAFSDMYFEGSQSVVIRKADAEKYTTYESFSGQLIAAQTGSIQEDLCTTFFPDAKLLSLQAVTDEFSNLINSKCEAVIVETGVAEGYVSQNEDLIISPLEVYEDSKGSSVAVKLGDPNGYLKQINETIKKVIENGDMDKWVTEAKEASQGVK